MAAPSPSDVAGDDRAAKIKSLLATYYADDADGRAPGHPPKSPSDLDAPSFDVERFIDKNLHAVSLHDLQANNTTLKTEIASLDSDMQLLVYENYSKFIVATDTVKAMRRNVESMDTRMTDLQGLIESVCSCNSQVDARLKERRAHIDSLQRVRSLLAKLQAVFDLPVKMRAALDIGAIEVMVQQYTEVRPVLVAFQHKGAFRKITTESDQLKRQAAHALKQRITTHPEEAADCLQLMQQLGEPLDHLRDDFITGVQTRLDGLLQVAGQVLMARAVAQGLLPEGSVVEKVPAEVAGVFEGEGQGEGNLPGFLRGINSLFLHELQHTASVFAEVFEKSPRTRLVKMAREVFARYVRIVRRACADATTLKAAEAAGITTMGALRDPQEALRSGMVDSDWGCRLVVNALQIIHQDLPRLSTCLPEVSPGDRASEILENVVRYHITACFGALEERVVASISTTLEQAQHIGNRRACAAQLLQLLVDSRSATQTTLKVGVDALLGEMKVYEQCSWLMNTWQGDFPHVVAGQVRQLLAQTEQRVAALAATCQGPQGRPGEGRAVPAPQGPAPVALDGAVGDLARERSGGLQGPSVFGGARTTSSSHEHHDPTHASSSSSTPALPQEPAPPAALLMLATLLRYMAHTLVQHLSNIHAAGLLGSPRGEEEGGRGVGGGVVPTELAMSLAHTSTSLLSQYIEAHTRRVTVVLRRSMDAMDWLHAKEPRAPRPVCDLLLERLGCCQQELNVLVQAAPPSSQQRRPVDNRGSKAHVLEFSAPVLLAALTRNAMHVLQTCVEQHVFGRQGLQQLQVDVAYLDMQFGRMFPELQATTALHAVLEAGTACCKQPVLLEQVVVQRIVARAVQELH